MPGAQTPHPLRLWVFLDDRLEALKCAGGIAYCFAEGAGKKTFLSFAFGAYWYWSKIFMHRDHDIFVRAIKDKRRVKLVFLSNTDGNNAKKLCGPMLYSPPAGAGESDWYYLWDFEGNSDKRVLGLPSNKIVSMGLTEETFDPKDFTTYERD